MQALSAPSGRHVQGPGLRDINAAIREDLAAQGPGPLAAAEAAARRQEAAAARRDTAAATGAARLEDLLLSGEMGALRDYLEQLQEALRGPAEAGTGGAGGGVGGAGGAGNLAAALDAFFGLPLAGQLAGGGGGAAGLGGQAAAGSPAGEAEEEGRAIAGAFIALPHACVTSLREELGHRRPVAPQLAAPCCHDLCPDEHLAGTDEEEEGEGEDFSDEEEEEEEDEEAEGDFTEGEEEGYSEEEEEDGDDEHGVHAGGQPGAQLPSPRVRAALLSRRLQQASGMACILRSGELHMF